MLMYYTNDRAGERVFNLCNSQTLKSNVTLLKLCTYEYDMFIREAVNPNGQLYNGTNFLSIVFLCKKRIHI